MLGVGCTAREKYILTARMAWRPDGKTVSREVSEFSHLTEELVASKRYKPRYPGAILVRRR